MPKLPNTLIVLPYDPNWKNEFELIRDYLMEQIGDLVIEIKHVGSTSVPGLCAKPIIDLVAIMDSYDLFPQIVARLEKVGYKHVGDQGIKEREVFKRLVPDDFMDYHFYVCPRDSEENRRHTRFRNALINNPHIAEEYGKLKTRLIEEVNGDRVLYTDSKTDFILDVMNKVNDDGVLKVSMQNIDVYMNNLVLHIQEIMILASTETAYVSKPLLNYALQWIDLAYNDKITNIKSLESALIDGLEVDFIGTQWEEEWIANGKVCNCKACNVARKCVADIELLYKLEAVK